MQLWLQLFVTTGLYSYSIQFVHTDMYSTSICRMKKKFQDSHLSKCCSQSQTVAVNAARTFTERCLLILGTCIFSCWDWPLEASVWAGCDLQQMSAGSHTGRWWTAAPRSHWRHSRAHPESWVYREKRCMWDAKVLTFIQTKQFPALYSDGSVFNNLDFFCLFTVWCQTFF